MVSLKNAIKRQKHIFEMYEKVVGYLNCLKIEALEL
jgi:hypothetical protein